jgi:hypothetical protein
MLDSLSPAPSNPSDHSYRLTPALTSPCSDQDTWLRMRVAQICLGNDRPLSSVGLNGPFLVATGGHSLGQTFALQHASSFLREREPCWNPAPTSRTRHYQMATYASAVCNIRSFVDTFVGEASEFYNVMPPRYHRLPCEMLRE